MCSTLIIHKIFWKSLYKIHYCCQRLRLQLQYKKKFMDNILIPVMVIHLLNSVLCIYRMTLIDS